MSMIKGTEPNLAEQNARTKELIDSIQGGELSKPEMHAKRNELFRLLRHRECPCRVKFELTLTEEDCWGADDQMEEWGSVFNSYNERARNFHDCDSYDILWERDGLRVQCVCKILPDIIDDSIAGAPHGSGVRKSANSARTREFILFKTHAITLNPDGYVGMAHNIRGCEIDLLLRDPDNFAGIELKKIEFVE